MRVIVVYVQVWYGYQSTRVFLCGDFERKIKIVLVHKASARCNTLSHVLSQAQTSVTHLVWVRSRGIPSADIRCVLGHVVSRAQTCSAY